MKKFEENNPAMMALQKFIYKDGGTVKEFAEKLEKESGFRVKPGVIYSMFHRGLVPLKYAPSIAKITGIDRKILCPKIYG